MTESCCNEAASTLERHGISIMDDGSVNNLVTVIRFAVRVPFIMSNFNDPPVLSMQATDTDPSVSTDVIFLTITFLSAILSTPRASVTVTTMGNLFASENQDDAPFWNSSDC